MRPIKIGSIFFIIMSFAPAGAWAVNCIPTKPDAFAGFNKLDPAIYADLPDPDPLAATAVIEIILLDKMVKGSIQSFSKTWCQIGIQRIVMDFKVPVEDDSVSHVLTRAEYIWDPFFEPIGWRIETLGERFICARGKDPLATPCP